MIRRTVIAYALALALMGWTALMISPVAAQPTEFESYATSGDLTEAHADVFRLYWAFFDREPEVGGAQYWVSRYDQCDSLLDITWSFSNSGEFLARYGTLSDQQYIDLVYQNVLDRSPDDSGRQYWLALLGQGDLIRAEVMLYFSLSQEFRNQHPLPSDGQADRGCTDPNASSANDVYYANCTEARAAGAAPIRRGEPGYRPGLDRDDDGVACEI